MARYKFKTEQEYLEWCSRIINKIHYRLFDMNSEGVRKVMSEITQTLHVCEGDRLIADAEDLEEENE